MPSVARQPIWTPDGSLHGHEYLYRSAQGLPAQVDLWPANRQDTATATVLEVLYEDGEPPGDARVFVNVTRSFLVRDLPLPRSRERLVLEVVESVAADADVLAGLATLRARGYLLAVDDFSASSAQLQMLPYADYVKIDCRDVERCGERLVDVARSHGARLVAERVSDARRLAASVRLGFDLLQGDLLGPARPVPDSSAADPGETRRARRVTTSARGAPPAAPAGTVPTGGVPLESAPVPMVPGDTRTSPGDAARGPLDGH